MQSRGNDRADIVLPKYKQQRLDHVDLTHFLIFSFSLERDDPFCYRTSQSPPFPHFPYHTPATDRSGGAGEKLEGLLRYRIYDPSTTLLIVMAGAS